MRVLGIDFGTSNTVAMLRSADGRIRPLLFDGSPLLPSAVYFNTDGRVLVGRDAERNARLDPSRFEPNPKRRIDDGEIFLGGQGLPVPRIIGYVLGQVAEEARRQLGTAVDEVRMTHPARWGERRRSLLVEAARLAGFNPPRLIAEPVGAASYFTTVLGSAVPIGRSLAIYDLGGGTFDATVVRRTVTGFEVLAEEGLADLGGLDFDHAIVEHLGRTYAASHPQEWAQLVTPAEPNHRRMRRMLYEDVRGAKEMLSRTAAADIHLPALDVDAHLTRDEFETLVRPYLERTVACLERAIVSARLGARDLVGIFLVGGSSRIPLAAHLIHTSLGVAPTTLEQPETVVVEGALCIGEPAGQRPPVQRPPVHRPAGQPAPAGPGQPLAGPRRGVAAQVAANAGARHPVSGPPVSGPPVSGPPVSGPPVSGPPVSGVPVSPAAAQPAARPPVVNPRPAPVSAAPISAAPVSGSPVSGSPVSGAPVSGSPASAPPISAPPAARPSAPAHPTGRPPVWPAPSSQPPAAPLGVPPATAPAPARPAAPPPVTPVTSAPAPLPTPAPSVTPPPAPVVHRPPATPPPVVQRPPVLPHPVPQPLVPQAVQQPVVQQQRNGGTEPAALWTIVILVLVAVAFVVLLAVVFSL